MGFICKNTESELSFLDVHPLTSEITSFYKPQVNEFKIDNDTTKTGEHTPTETVKINELDLLNESFKFTIEKIRVMFNEVDKFSETLISSLQGVRGITSFEDKRKDQIVFALPHTPVKTKITYPEDGFSSHDLVTMSNAESETHLFDSFFFLVKTLSIQGCDCTKLLNWYEIGYKKPKTRRRTSINLSGTERVIISLVRNNYLCAHYTAADLSMLSDFNELKSELAIINKSFVTLGKPLKYESSNIYIRDTILLAHAGKSSLDALGSLYTEEGDFSKRVISQDDIEKISKFIDRDRKGFEDYAVQDAVITLKHAISMEQFNFGIQQLGVPTTLASLGQNYVMSE